MNAWLHFGKSDYLLFETWRPSSNGAIAGTCIAIFAFAIFDRSLAALRRTREDHWKTRLVHTHKGFQLINALSALDGGKAVGTGEVVGEVLSTDSPHDAKNISRATLRSIPPFVPFHDIPRGIIYAIQTASSYILMLTVMTFNAAYIISIILGLGVGEVLFGRIAPGPSTHPAH
ncbi:Ctr copper transporter [Pisolithus orientalis]|uniref:Ctr copper transporter n=1 Tax=Pisolithus orientalis TaxID=936130 RepID=UPI002224DFEC|nr:Ctr copper transporter [Pisolithus orientalis]KAI6005081.1 Ctr copper transporter [Pisolithus orientalis]